MAIGSAQQFRTANTKATENPSAVASTISNIQTPAKDKARPTKAMLQLVARWFSPADPNINVDPLRSTSGHPMLQTPWGPMPSTVEGQQLASKNRYNLDWDHEYSIRPAFSPGNGYFAYCTFGLTEFTAIGAGVANRKQIRFIDPPAYMPIQSIPPIGLPHDAGEVTLQGLQIDNPDLQGYVG
jgi:hypothetical protein